MIALGSEDWDPVSTIVNTLSQAMLQGHWLVLDNCHLMPFWPRELLQPLQGLLDGAKGKPWDGLGYLTFGPEFEFQGFNA